MLKLFKRFMAFIKHIIKTHYIEIRIQDECKDLPLSGSDDGDCKFPFCNHDEEENSSIIESKELNYKEKIYDKTNKRRFKRKNPKS